MFRNILVATDGSDLAEKGVNQGIALASQLGSKLTFVSVTELLPSYGIVVAAEWASSPESFEDYRDSITKSANEILKKARDKAKEAGVAAEAVHIENQSPAHGIIDAAKAYECDLIIVSSHGRSGVSKLLLGSQAATVLAESTVPVLILK